MDNSYYQTNMEASGVFVEDIGYVNCAVYNHIMHGKEINLLNVELKEADLEFINMYRYLRNSRGKSARTC